MKPADGRTLLLALNCAATLALAGCAPASTPATFTNPIQPVGQDPFVRQWAHRYLFVEERNDNEVWIRESRANDLTVIASRGNSHRVWTTPMTGGKCPPRRRMGELDDGASHKAIMLDRITFAIA